MGLRERLEATLAAGKDDALLRYSLGQLCLQSDETALAATHLARAVELNPAHSASWKLYGRALEADGQPQPALAAYRQGLTVAANNGDRQAMRELQVFIRRLEKSAART